MMLRMYLRYLENKGSQVEIDEITAGMRRGSSLQRSRWQENTRTERSKANVECIGWCA